MLRLRRRLISVKNVDRPAATVHRCISSAKRRISRSVQGLVCVAPPRAKEAAMRLTSSAFADGGVIPRRFTCNGEDISPPLAWSDVPPGTRGFTLLCDDPDAPAGTWRHGAIYDVPADRTELAEDADRRTLNWQSTIFVGPAKADLARRRATDRIMIISGCWRFRLLRSRFAAADLQGSSSGKRASTSLPRPRWFLSGRNRARRSRINFCDGPANRVGPFRSRSANR